MTAATQESRPGGTGERDGGLESDHPVAGAPSQGEASGNATTPDPPGLDNRIRSANAARAWLNGQPAPFKAAVGARAAEVGLALADASLADLQALIRAAWRDQEAA